MVVADQGTEFTGASFVNTVNDAGAWAPRQNARTERAGGIFKTKLEAVAAETTSSYNAYEARLETRQPRFLHEYRYLGFPIYNPCKVYIHTFLRTLTKS